MNCESWPYPNELGTEETIESDVLVLGGGMAGCYAAIAAARKGKRVVLVEKGATERSGAAGSGFDHWESACSNPCSGVTPEEYTAAIIDEQDGYANAVARWIESSEGWDRLLDMESFGGKIRDTEDEFKGADFRDEKTKLMFAYDYKNRFTIRVWGSTFKPALYHELKRLGVKVVDRTEATALLVAPSTPLDTTIENAAKDISEMPPSGSERGTSCYGALGMNVHTGRFMVFKSKATILCMSRPARVWLFDSDQVGLCEFRPTQSIGSGHAMGYRAGVEFTMMEKSVQGEFSAAGRSFPPYSTGNNHNTWYAATMVDARGVEIPYVDRDGRELKTVKERYYPAPGQHFFLKGGIIDNPKYEYRGPETLPFDELMKRGYQLPFYADLSKMPDAERRVIWGMMVGEEGKTKIPVLKSLTDRGFNPARHRLQSYGSGWQSAAFLPQERQLFGAPGGVYHDWDLKTNIDGLYAAGDQLFSADCAGFAATTGYYAGCKAAEAVSGKASMPPCADDSMSQDIAVSSSLTAQIASEKQRLYAPLYVEDGMDWRELNKAISKAMQNYCGGVKNDMLLRQGLELLKSYELDYVPLLSCHNPHELMRTHEVLDILEVSKMILNACLLRKSDSQQLCFERSDNDPSQSVSDDCFITIYQEHGNICSHRYPKWTSERFLQELKKRKSYQTQPPQPHKGEDFVGEKPPQPHKGGDFVGEGGKAQPLKTQIPKTHLEGDFVGVSENLCHTFTAQPISCSVTPIRFDESKCIGCNRCAAVCQVDIMIPSAVKGKHPVVLYPGECYYCGSCVMACRQDAIKLTHPLMNQTKFVEVK